MRKSIFCVQLAIEGGIAMDEEVFYKFGALLREWRMEWGLSQYDVAELLGTGQSYVSKIERGEVDVRLSTISRLAASLDLDVWELFRGPESPRPSKWEINLWITTRKRVRTEHACKLLEKARLQRQLEEEDL